MAHPRATFPDRMISEYKAGAGIHKLASEYRSNNRTIRRWLSERTEIRRNGTRGPL